MDDTRAPNTENGATVGVATAEKNKLMASSSSHDMPSKHFRAGRSDISVAFDGVVSGTGSSSLDSTMISSPSWRLFFSLLAQVASEPRFDSLHS